MRGFSSSVFLTALASSTSMTTLVGAAPSTPADPALGAPAILPGIPAVPNLGALSVSGIPGSSTPSSRSDHLEARQLGGLLDTLGLGDLPKLIAGLGLCPTSKRSVDPSPDAGALMAKLEALVQNGTAGLLPGLPICPSVPPGASSAPGAPVAPPVPGSLPALPAAGLPSLPGLPGTPSLPSLPGLPAPGAPGAPPAPGAPGAPTNNSSAPRSMLPRKHSEPSWVAPAQAQKGGSKNVVDFGMAARADTSAVTGLAGSLVGAVPSPL